LYLSNCLENSPLPCFLQYHYRNDHSPVIIFLFLSSTVPSITITTRSVIRQHTVRCSSKLTITILMTINLILKYYLYLGRCNCTFIIYTFIEKGGTQSYHLGFPSLKYKFGKGVKLPSIFITFFEDLEGGQTPF
jgi:hypothetical protein